MNNIVSIKRGRPKKVGNSELRKAQILSVASKAFAEFGYDHTDVNIVSDELGIGKGTIYYYFQNKEELFLACVDWLMQELLKSVNLVITPEKDQVDVIQDAVQAYLSFFDEHPEFVELLIQERAIFKNRDKPTYFKYREQNLKPWEQRYKELVKAGRVRQMPIDRILDVIGDILYGVVFTNYFAGRTKTMKEQAKDVLDIYFNGILSDSEIKNRKTERL